MRRGFWLVTGAVLGATGYRKASRVARDLTGRAAAASALQGRRRQPSAIQLRWRSPLALSLRTPARSARAGRPAERIVSAAGFVRDVHEGMAEYWDLHRGDADRTLGSQDSATSVRTLGSQDSATSARTPAGGSDLGHRGP